MPTDWQKWLPMSSPIDGRLTTPAHSEYDEPSPVADVGVVSVAPPPPVTVTETTQYADEEDNTRDHFPRRLRGTLPEDRRWWVPGLKTAMDLWKEVHTGWKGIFIGVLATTAALACMRDGGGGGGSGNIRHLRQWGHEMQGRLPFKR